MRIGHVTPRDNDSPDKMTNGRVPTDPPRRRAFREALDSTRSSRRRGSAGTSRTLQVVKDLGRRPLGNSGIEVSPLALGSWRTYERIPREQGIGVMRAREIAGSHSWTTPATTTKAENRRSGADIQRSYSGSCFAPGMEAGRGRCRQQALVGVLAGPVRCPRARRFTGSNGL